MSSADFAPSIDLRGDLAYVTSSENHTVAAEVLDRSAAVAHAIAQLFPGVDAVVDATTKDEAIRKSRGPLEGHFAKSTKPDRDGPRGLGQECRPANPVEAAREVDDRFSEQPPEQLDLLLLPGAAGTEVLTERLVLDVIPADSHAEAQPAAGQEINVGCLPGHERGLALRKNQDPSREMDSLGDAGQMREHHERVVKWIVLGVGTRQCRRAIGMNGTEHVVVREEVVKAEVFDRSPDPPNRVRISSNLGLWVDDTDLHGLQPFHAMSSLI